MSKAACGRSEAAQVAPGHVRDTAKPILAEHKTIGQTLFIFTVLSIFILFIIVSIIIIDYIHVIQLRRPLAKCPSQS